MERAMVAGRPVSGWIPFTGTILLFTGAVNAIDGIAAITKDHILRGDNLLILNITAWGWIWLVLGVLQVCSAYWVFQRRMAGMVLAVTFAFIAGLAHTMAIGAYPMWSVMVLVLCFLIMYGVLTNSDQFE